jgi:hypothetical protein
VSAAIHNAGGVEAKQALLEKTTNLLTTQVKADREVVTPIQPKPMPRDGSRVTKA